MQVQGAAGGLPYSRAISLQGDRRGGVAGGVVRGSLSESAQVWPLAAASSAAPKTTSSLPASFSLTLATIRSRWLEWAT